MTLRERAVEELLEDLNGELYTALGQAGRNEISIENFSLVFDRLIESRMVKISHRPVEIEGLDYHCDRKAV